jgi:hypothetical protein
MDTPNQSLRERLSDWAPVKSEFMLPLQRTVATDMGLIGGEAPQTCI